MKLNHAHQVGLRRRKPEQRRQLLAFWAGIAILVAFELILMAKGWSVDGPFAGAVGPVAADDSAASSPLPAPAN